MRPPLPAAVSERTNARPSTRLGAPVRCASQQFCQHFSTPPLDTSDTSDAQTLQGSRHATHHGWTGVSRAPSGPVAPSRHKAALHTLKMCPKAKDALEEQFLVDLISLSDKHHFQMLNTKEYWWLEDLTQLPSPRFRSPRERRSSAIVTPLCPKRSGRCCVKPVRYFVSSPLTRLFRSEVRF